MDRLFAQAGKRNILITAAEIPDETGAVGVGVRDMLISALSDMSATSNALPFVDVQAQQGVVFTTQTYVGQLRPETQRYSPPSVYVRGSITAADRNVTDDKTSIGLASQWASLGYSEDQITGVISLDLQLGDIVTRRLYPGVKASNTIVVINKSRGADAEGLISKAGVNFSVSQGRSEGVGAAVRTLIELSAIELMGKFTKVPYWRCLEIPSTDPSVMQNSRSNFDRLDEPARIRVAQSALSARGYYSGPADGQFNRAFQTALSKYQVASGLIADGRLSFDTWLRLENDAGSPLVASASGLDKPTPAPASFDAPLADTAGRDPLGLVVTPVAAGYWPPKIGDRLEIDVSVTQPANVYCYYEFVQDHQYKTARIFPNAATPSPRLAPGRPLRLPNKGFAMEASENEESIGCVATTANYDHLPNKPLMLAAQPLTPNPIRLYSVIDSHQKADTTNTSISVLSFKGQR